MTEGYWHTRLYRIWAAMKQRCYNKNAQNYKHYGGRGITICDEWRNNFEAFCEWALTHGYKDPPLNAGHNRSRSLTIDRINNDKGYSPDNCQWITLSENISKKREGSIYHNVAVRDFVAWLDNACEETAKRSFPKKYDSCSRRRMRDFIAFGVNRQLGINKISCMEEKDIPKARAFAEKVFALFD